jgi:hypothetical protein
LRCLAKFYNSAHAHWVVGSLTTSPIRNCLHLPTTPMRMCGIFGRNGGGAVKKIHSAFFVDLWRLLVKHTQKWHQHIINNAYLWVKAYSPTFFYKTNLMKEKQWMIGFFNLRFFFVL